MLSIRPAASFLITCSLNFDAIHEALNGAFNEAESAPAAPDLGVRLSYLGNGGTFGIDKEHASPRAMESILLTGIGALIHEAGNSRIHIDYFYDIGVALMLAKALGLLGAGSAGWLLVNLFFYSSDVGTTLSGVLILLGLVAIPFVTASFLRFEIGTLHRNILNILRKS